MLKRLRLRPQRDDAVSLRRQALLARHAAAHFNSQPTTPELLEAAALTICRHATSREEAAELLRCCGLLTYAGRKIPPNGFRVIPGTQPPLAGRASATPRPRFGGATVRQGHGR
jgi:hypothetical protein